MPYGPVREIIVKETEGWIELEDRLIGITVNIITSDTFQEYRDTSEMYLEPVIEALPDNYSNPETGEMFPTINIYRPVVDYLTHLQIACEHRALSGRAPFSLNDSDTALHTPLETKRDRIARAIRDAMNGPSGDYLRVLSESIALVSQDNWSDALEMAVPIIRNVLNRLDLRTFIPPEVDARRLMPATEGTGIMLPEGMIHTYYD